MGGKIDNWCLSCFMIETSGYNSPRTNQEFLDEDPCSLMQRCLAVCIDGTDDGPCVSRWVINDTVIPHLERFVKALAYLANITRDGRGLTGHQWLDGASRTPSSQTKKNWRKTSPTKSLIETTEWRTEGRLFVDSPADRRSGSNCTVKFQMTSFK